MNIQRWEYRSAWLASETLDASLNALGHDGWELVQSIDTDTDRKHLCVFKRAVKD